MPLLAYDDADEPYVSLAATVTAASAALVLGAGGGVLLAHLAGDVPTRPAAGSATTGRSASPSPTDCLPAVASADAALAEALKVDAALATQTKVMDDLVSHRITGEQALKELAPALTSRARQSVALDVAIQRYRATALVCRP